MNDLSFQYRAELASALDQDGDPRPRLSVVVPCYNEEACLDVLYRRVVDAARATVGDDFELVMIDDGSRDRTWEIMRDLAAQDERVIGLYLGTLGQAEA